MRTIRVATVLASFAAICLDVGVIALEMPADEPAEGLARSLADQGSLNLLYLYPPGVSSPKQLA